MPVILFTDPHILGATTGGAEVQLWILASGFQKAGWQVHYVTDTDLSESRREGIYLHSLGRSGTTGHRQRFFSTLKDINPDVIYQRGRKSHTSLVGDYAEKTGTPFIFATSMDIDCGYFKETGRLLRQVQAFAAKMRLLPRRARQDISSLRGMKKASVILTQSELQQRLLKSKLGMESIVFRNLHPVPDAEQIVKETPPLVLWLASVKQWKRPELFLELAESLRHKNYRFILAGRLADRDVYEQTLYEYSKNNRYFQYIEDVDLERSNELIARASIFVNTSEPFEGFPNTFIQSWLRKTVVFSMSVDPDELISSHKIGKLSGDIGKMASQISVLLENPQLLESMGRNARKFALEEFGYSNKFPEIESLAKGLLG